MDTTKKRSLGRGLSALLDPDEGLGITTHAMPSGGGISQIAIEFIEPNPFQPRTGFDMTALNDLADSIKQHGVIQPITLRRISKDKYQLISGERRWKASQIAGLTEIPAYVRVANDQAMLEMALIENTHREDLDAIEIAIGYRRLIEECGLTQESLSEKVSRDRTTVTNFLRLLKLPPIIQLAIREKKITTGHAKALIGIDNPADQLRLFDKIMDESLNVRETESRVKETKSNFGKQNHIIINQDDKLLEKKLSEKLSSKVKLARTGKEKGKLLISFSSDEELKKIAGIINNGL